MLSLCVSFIQEYLGLLITTVCVCVDEQDHGGLGSEDGDTEPRGATLNQWSGD